MLFYLPQELLKIAGDYHLDNCKIIPLTGLCLNSWIVEISWQKILTPLF
jgi:hypothetical protein